MQVYKGLQGFKKLPSQPIVIIGVFDGVHIGHQQLVRSAIRMAEQVRSTSVAITFDPDPQQILYPQRAPKRLMSLDIRCRHLSALGLNRIWVIPFTRAFSLWSAQQFISRILIDRLNVRALFVGETFVFGKDREGSVALLKQMGKRHHIYVEAVPAVYRSGSIVSSSRIRGLITKAQLSKAKSLLGRAVALYGKPIAGEGRGRGLGFPTINIQLTSQVLPPQGVFAVTMRLGRRIYKGLMNFGIRPTFGSGPVTCEVYLFNYSGSRPKHQVEIMLHRRLRSERRFHSSEGLIRQIRKDVLRSKTLFQSVA